MKADKIIVYRSYIDPIEANIVKGLLDTFEIKCFLSDENMITLNAMYSPAVGGVKLNVFEKDIDRIANVIQSENYIEEASFVSEIKANTTFCPKCHSENVSYGGSINKKFSTWHVFYSFLLMIYPISMRKANHCFDCNHEFKKNKTSLMNQFESISQTLLYTIEKWEPHLLGLSNAIISEPKNIQNRSIRQILGHLVDSASNNTHRIVHLQYRENPMTFPNYASEGNNDR